MRRRNHNYEASHFKTVKTEPEFGTMTSRSNLALNDEWQLPDVYPTRTAEYSKPRRENFVAYFQKDTKSNDDAKHRAYLSRVLRQRMTPETTKKEGNRL